jgi:predicted Na+-dependent transporter
MIVPWLIFMAVGLITYAGFVKLAARLLRYKVPWKSSFLFAVMVLALVIFDHVLAFDQPVATRIVHAVVLLLILLTLGSWFFKARGMNRRDTVLGWGGGMRLIALAFAMMVVVAFAIVLPVQAFLSKHLSPPP